MGAVTGKTWSHPRHPLIVADANMWAASPCVEGSGISVGPLKGRFIAGEGVIELAARYFISRRTIEAALRFALDQSAMRAWRKWRKEALEVECTRVCTNCSRRVAVRWCSKWKFFYHGEPRYACSASAIRELFAARWPEQFGPKEPTVQPKEVRDGA